MGLRAFFKEIAGKKPDLADYNTLRSNTYLTDVKTELGRMSYIQAVARRNEDGQWDVSYEAMKLIRGVKLREAVSEWKGLDTAAMKARMEDFERDHGPGCNRLNRFSSSYQRVMRPAA